MASAAASVRARSTSCWSLRRRARSLTALRVIWRSWGGARRSKMQTVRRFRNSGGKVWRRRATTSDLTDLTSVVLCKSESEPTFEVRMTTDWVKSTVRPFPSVMRPSSRTWRRTFNSVEWAFSISSKRTTVWGDFLTASVSCPPASCPTYPGGEPMRRATAWASEYSEQSIRTRFFGSSKSSEARALAVAVFPTPVGPRKRNVPKGLSVLASPARARRIAATTTSIAASWPTTTFLSRDASSSKRDLSLLCNFATGTPVHRATTSATSSGVTESRLLFVLSLF
mmetsp:Transcript_2579/g.8658  ORF Transcript_2579/g.8658 Transcript_2579/m.8658 type:complete len:283 (+) Transcript_2579:296-1144(+)